MTGLATEMLLKHIEKISLDTWRKDKIKLQQITKLWIARNMRIRNIIYIFYSRKGWLSVFV
jgi:hypothetical protein